MITTIAIFSILLIIGILLYFNLKRKNSQLSKSLDNIRKETEAYYKELFNSWCITHEKKIRKDSVERSRSIIRGQATEHLAPFIINNSNPKDYRFLGSPIDYIIFHGLSDVLDGEKQSIEKITFLDIKTGKSRLNKSQRKIRDAINNGKVEFVMRKIDEQ